MAKDPFSFGLLEMVEEEQTIVIVMAIRIVYTLCQSVVQPNVKRDPGIQNPVHLHLQLHTAVEIALINKS